VTVGNQSADDIDQAIDWAAVARMLNLGNVLQMVSDGFDDGTLTQQQTI
jgi:hypothetical protein